MRVLLEHRNGANGDPIDIGALWDWSRAPDSEPGDYWLILPAAIPPDKRTAIAGDDQPATPAGKATNDLIDADGNRRDRGRDAHRPRRHRTASRTQARDRRSRPITIHIEHAKGSKITIDQDGNITVQSAADLALKAAGNMTPEASAVKVKVASTMDVSKK